MVRHHTAGILREPSPVCLIRPHLVRSSRKSITKEGQGMAGVRRGAVSVMKWFAALYVVLIIIQVYLAGEGIFGLNNIKNSDDCDKTGAHCIANSKTLDAHRFLGFFLTFPGAILFLIVALCLRGTRTSAYAPSRSSCRS